MKPLNTFPKNAEKTCFVTSVKTCLSNLLALLITFKIQQVLIRTWVGRQVIMASRNREVCGRSPEHVQEVINSQIWLQRLTMAQEGLGNFHSVNEQK